MLNVDHRNDVKMFKTSSSEAIKAAACGSTCVSLDVISLASKEQKAEIVKNGSMNRRVLGYTSSFPRVALLHIL